MPIRPENRSKYPDDWREIRIRILERAQHKCEQCGLQNHQVGIRDINGIFWTLDDLELEDVNLHPEAKIFKIVLTVAHLDHDPTNNQESNLTALCQKCHLGWDAEHHAQSRKTNREKRIGQINLF